MDLGFSAKCQGTPRGFFVISFSPGREAPSHHRQLATEQKGAFLSGVGHFIGSGVWFDSGSNGESSQTYITLHLLVGKVEGTTPLPCR